MAHYTDYEAARCSECDKHFMRKIDLGQDQCSSCCEDQFLQRKRLEKPLNIVIINPTNNGRHPKDAGI